MSLDESGLLGGINLVSGPQPLQGLSDCSLQRYY